MAINLFVCDCHLINNSRMVSSYLIMASNKNHAKAMMRDGLHIVDGVRSLADYVMEMGWPNLSTEQERDVMEHRPVCLVAGT